MIDIGTLLNHYKRQDVQKQMLQEARNREVAVRFNDIFGTRPNMLKYERDILELAKQGVTSFHSSEELWTDPMRLGSELTKQESDSMRLGWDLVLDVDCAILDYSKIAADLIIKALKNQGLSSYSVKFSGNKGFHIGVPFEAFPKTVSDKETRLLFPEAPRKIAFFLREKIRTPLAASIMEFEKGDLAKVAQRTGKPAAELIDKRTGTPELKVESFLNIDTLLISSRHLFRMPYSLHEKSGLVSIPVDPEKILSFERERADPKGFTISSFVFLDRKCRPEEAKRLLIQAYDLVQEEKKVQKAHREFELPTEAVPEEQFPPCIKKILAGLLDGRKRGVFILVNFLSCMGWSYEAIEARLDEWNKKNTEPLREVYIQGQIKAHKHAHKRILPPNCSNESYYKDMGVKCEEGLCTRCRNPVNYVKRRSKK